MMDTEMEQRIWERVNAAEMPRRDLRGMELRCLESEACFRGLAAQLGGEAREQLRNLARMEHSNAMAIRGMQILDGEEPEQTGFPPQRENVRRALALSLRRSQEAWQDYAAHSLSGEYGPVFARMQAGEAAIQAAILGLIAGIGRSRG